MGAKAEEAKLTVPLENKWSKTGKTWEKVNLKPATRISTDNKNKEENSEAPFKINLKTVNQRIISVPSCEQTTQPKSKKLKSLKNKTNKNSPAHTSKKDPIPKCE